MPDRSTRYTYTRTAEFTAVRGDQNRGFHRFRSTTYRVAVEFVTDELVPNGPDGPYIVPSQTYANEIVDDWLTEYLTDRDLNESPGLDAASSAELADRLLLTFSGLSTNVRAVTLTVGDESWRAEFPWEALA